MATTYRLYTWQLFQLNPMQQGIQALHALGELAAFALQNPGPLAQIVQDYLVNDKTVICLNGGNVGQLVDNYRIASTYATQLGLPHAIFHEDMESLGELPTAFAVVVPDSVWGLDLSAYNNMMSPAVGKAEQFALFISKFPLAR